MTATDLGSLKPSNSKSDSTANTVSTHPELLILHVDVSQGESTLILEREGETVKWCCIIDGGYGPYRGLLIRYLERFKVSVVDLMVCSHFDSDHVQGLISLLSEHVKPLQTPNVTNGVIFVQKVLVRCDNALVSKSETKGRFLQAAQLAKAKIVKAKSGRNYGPEAVSSSEVRPVLTCIRATSADFLKDENRGSLAFRLDYGDFSYYTAGDLPIADEDSILSQIGAVDAFKCGHHGSAGSTSQALLDAIQPRVAVISCGSNSHGHPTFEVIDRLCHNKSRLQGVYLTNCIHNRRCVNPRYQEQETSIRDAYLSLEEMKPLASSLPSQAVYDTKAIEQLIASLQKEEQQASDDDTVALLRKRQKILRAMLRSAAHYANASAFDGTTVAAHVGGGPAHFGTIALRVPLQMRGKKKAVFDVGLFEAAESAPISFRWYRHGSEGVEVLEGPEVVVIGILSTEEETLRAQGKRQQVEVSKVGTTPIRSRRRRKVATASASTSIGTSINNNNAPTTTTGSSTGLATPVSKPTVSRMPRSPGTTEAMVTKRWQAYLRFAMPTLAGLHTHEQKTWIPFCALCRMDADTDEGDFELVDVFQDDEPNDGEVQFHRLCYWELLQRLVPVEQREVTIGDAYNAEQLPLPPIETGLAGVWTTILRDEFRKKFVNESTLEAQIVGTIARMKVQVREGASDDDDSDYDDTY